jgi:chromatin remodeling complex protein RSC6
MAGNRANNFVTPQSLSDAMCDILGLPHGSGLGRVEVTRKLIDYVKRNNLEDPTNRRKILADANLSNIIVDVDGLTYFNLQSRINHNFLGQVPFTATAIHAPTVSFEEKMEEWDKIIKG